MKRTRIMYVDDDEALAQVVRETLERGGYEVVVNTDTEAAPWRFSKDPGGCDLAILDHVMPPMHGIELARVASASTGPISQ